MTRSALVNLTLLVTLVVLSTSACVDPPVAERALCKDDTAQNLCTADNNPAYAACCNALNELHDEPLTSAQQDYYSSCVRAVRSSDTRQDQCLREPLSITDTWEMDRVVTGCRDLFASIESESEREQDYVLPCIEALLETKFVPSHAADPFALTVMCDKFKGTINAAYSLSCINILADYAWFPAGPSEFTIAADRNAWDRIDNQIPQLCLFNGMCSGDQDGALSCMQSFLNFEPEGKPAIKVNLMFESIKVESGLSCTLCDKDRSMNCRELDSGTCGVFEILIDDRPCGTAQ